MSLEWFPFAPKPFISDTLRLNTEAKGAYLMLMLDYYDQERPAPDDDEVLASITGLPIETWRRHRRVIEPLFDVRDGLWHHIKCAAVLADQHARVKKLTDASQAGVEARKRNRTGGRTAGKTDGRTAGTTNGSTGGHTDGATVVEADFGPSRPSVEPAVPPTVQPTVQPMVKNTSEPTNGTTDGVTDGVTNGSTDGATHYTIEQDKREGANAPSPAGEVLIGSLIDPNFTPNSEAVASALNVDGISADELSAWLDDWKGRCMEAGTRLDDWRAAWGREYHRRMIERAAKKPKPRVSVSKKRLEKIPEGWAPGPTHHKIADERGLNIIACLESFSDYLVNKRPDWKDADAAFRQWLKSPHRSEFRRNGQAQPTRRAPAPGGSSIVDAFDRIDARIDAAAGGAAADDQQDGQAAVHRLPQG